jgi:ribosome-associated translation inhibitor RaiA
MRGDSGIMRKQNIISLLMICGIFMVASPVFSAESKRREAPVGQVDTILDRLEKRLLDQEADGVTFSDRNGDLNFLKQPVDTKAKKYQFKGGKIEATAPEKDRLKAIEVLVADLERQVDALAAKVQKTKQSLIDDATLNNSIAVDAQIDGVDKATIKSMRIRLDGYELYSISDTSGLWLPSKVVPIYSGPLQPGSHRLDLEVRLMLRTNPDLPLNTDLYRFVSKSFTMTVAGGSTQSRYVIAIKAPESIDDSADASLKEMI